MDEILLDEQKAPTLYAKRGILIATFLTGPLTAGVLLRSNLIELGQPKKAQSVLLGFIAFSLALVALLLFLVDRIPNVVFPIVYTGITGTLIQSLMGEELDKNKAKNGPNFPTSRLIGVAVLYAIINVASALLFFLVIDSLTV